MGMYKRRESRTYVVLICLLTCLKIQVITSYRLSGMTKRDLVPSLVREKLNERSQCKRIKGLGSPVNIFRTYFQQTLDSFFVENKKSQVTLMYYRESREEVSTHRYIFSIRKNSSSSIQYIGIISLVPQFEFDKRRYKQYVIRYVQDREFESVKALIGIHDVCDNYRLSCPTMKNDLVRELVENPVMPYTCLSGIKSNRLGKESAKDVFRKNLEAIRQVLGEFGFELSLSDLLFDQKVIGVLERVFGSMKVVQRDLKVLKKQIKTGGSRSHEALLRRSSKADMLRCRDILDMRDKCSSKDKKCLSIEEASQLRNHLMLLYMLDKRRILSRNTVKGNFQMLKLSEYEYKWGTRND